MTKENTHMPDPATSDDTGVGPGRKYPGMPRWVKVSGIIVIGLVLFVVVALLVATALGLHEPSVGPGGHGPGGQTPPGDAGDHTLPYQAERLNVGTFQRLNVPLEHGLQRP